MIITHRFEFEKHSKEKFNEDERTRMKEKGAVAIGTELIKRIPFIKDEWNSNEVKEEYKCRFVAIPEDQWRTFRDGVMSKLNRFPELQKDIFKLFYELEK